MKAVKKLSLLALALLVVSCNEKVSPELLESSVSTPGGPIIAPEEYYFRLINTSPLMLNFNVHKTGAGNTKAPCEIKRSKAAGGISNDIFVGSIADDITCYFEAEELSLYFNGMKFAVEASPNTCDYVGYSPFSYFHDLPGSSSGSFTEIKCTNEDTTDTHVALEAGAGEFDDNAAGLPGGLGCNGFASNNIPGGSAVREALTIPENDAELCRFNYPDGGDQCDEGTIDIFTYSVTYTPLTDSAPPSLKTEPTKRTVKCGGKAGNCIRGPIRQASQFKEGMTRLTVLTQVQTNETYKKEESLSPLMGVTGSNQRYANYRRNLASDSIDYGSADPDGVVYSNYKSAFSGRKDFTPRLMDLYSANKDLDGNKVLVDQPMINEQANVANMYMATPYAADPYLGLYGYRTSPFYTLYCLDKALDIKARIKMVVRDWDRVFPNNANNELISDIDHTIMNTYLGIELPDGRQDNPEGVEVQDDDDPLIPFNDYKDWDDRIPMERTGAVWSPTAGFFKRQLFWDAELD